MGYSLCIMADFQNGLISGTFVFFLELFFAQNISKLFVVLFWHVFLNFTFWSILKNMSRCILQIFLEVLCAESRLKKQQI